MIVTAERRHGDLHLSVADNGPGVSPEARRLIFEKFRQSKESDSDQAGGTGLGLAISRQIVEYFGGRIWVESVPGRGARFCVTLPFSQAQVGRVAE